MARTMRLMAEEATSAAAIQRAIDGLSPTGGRVLLPEMEVVLDRGLELRSGIELVGQGSGTVLRMAPARVYPLAGYHNYGMCDVPLDYVDGLEPGMTVAIRDNSHHGFFETLARIIWIDGTWVGLDHGLESDYHADSEPVLITSFPLIYGLGVEDVAVRDLALHGNLEQQPAGIGACRGAAVYFLRSHGFQVTDVQESAFAGEGLGFQMCSHGLIRGCQFNGNTGNGYHPGAGSTAVLFEDCVAEHNVSAGFFFCVRANHLTVRNCLFRGNVACGISVGTRDCNNLIEGCRAIGNDGPGILFRPAPRPVEVHSCRIRGCQIEGNAGVAGRAQIYVAGDAHDLILESNEISGSSAREAAGIYLAPSTERIWLMGNRIAGSFPEVVGGASSLAQSEPSFTCGVEAVEAVHFRHLAPERITADE